MGESCDGVSNDCPSDTKQPNGANCSDGQFCNGAETCQGGVCQNGAEPCALLCDEAHISALPAVRPCWQVRQTEPDHLHHRTRS